MSDFYNHDNLLFLKIDKPNVLIMYRIKLIAVSLAILVLGCSENKKENAESKNTSEPETETSEMKAKKKANQEDLIDATVNFNADGESQKIDNFDKRRSEITWADESTMVRLSTIDREKFFVLNLADVDLTQPKPMQLTLNPNEKDKLPYGSLVFQGVFGDMDDMSGTRFIEGSATIDHLEKGSLEFEMSFDGLAVHSDIVNKQKDTMNIKGTIKSKFDHDLDVTTK